MGNQSDKITRQLSKTPRFHYPEDEARYPWLSILLDAYHLTDAGIEVELAEEIKRRNQQPGCHRGCLNCCLKANVPISQLERAGIAWFVTAKLSGDARRILEDQLQWHKDIPHCPFIVDSLCSIYPVRPLACRIFYVFGTPCESASSISTTRKADIWTHSRDLARRVAMIILPFYGIKAKAEKIKAFKEGFIFKQMTLLRSEPWEEVAKRMLELDEKTG